MKHCYILLFLLQISLSQNSQSGTPYIDSVRGFRIPPVQNVQIIKSNYNPDGVSGKEYLDILFKNKTTIYGDFIDGDEYSDNLTKTSIESIVTSQVTDGPDGSSWCRNIDSFQVKTSRNGIKYVKFYLMCYSSSYVYNKTDSTVSGPFFTVDLSNLKRKQILYLDIRSSWPSAKKQYQIIDKIIEGITINK